MNPRRIGAMLALSALLAPAHAQTEIQWWHSMTGANNTGVNELATRFNASQKEYKIVPVFKGSYPESMTAAIAAFRAGNPPHILQVFEVGTATMMAAKGAIVPVAKVMADAKEPFDPKAYLPTVTGYYSDSKGNMLSYPFNSSTVVFYVNKDSFKKAGLDPEKAPKTWKEFSDAAQKLKAAGHECVYTTGWPAWMHIENFSAWHNVPIGTRQNGMGGLDTEFRINSPLHVRHVAMLGDMAKKGLFTYSGRRNEGEARFASGECPMMTSSTGAQGTISRTAKFAWSVNFMPYHDDVLSAKVLRLVDEVVHFTMRACTFAQSHFAGGGHRPIDQRRDGAPPLRDHRLGVCARADTQRGEAFRLAGAEAAIVWHREQRDGFSRLERPDRNVNPIARYEQRVTQLHWNFEQPATGA